MMLALTLGACGQPSQPEALAAEQRAAAAAPHFPCATGAGQLRPACTAERARAGHGWIITLRHPDGHFRRLAVGDDDRVTAADGAQPAQVTPGSAGVSVAIGGDRYLLPAQR